ncbi:putative protease with the C-terminal PDZ domain [Burkholderiales bacterium]|nr:putative protease with the C-terminal PDZ domain [Burkholderiales bacterium]
MTVRYGLLAADPGAHLFQVTVEVDQPDPSGQRFLLPAWIPGSYMIRDFARNIVRLRALNGAGRRVRIEKTDKHSWRCAPLGPGETLTLAYEVYAYDLSVRSAHLDTTHGFFNGSSVFLLAVGREHDACRVDIFAPRERRYRDWQVATALVPAGGTQRGQFGSYLARDYDELIDCPVELGRFVTGHFTVGGVAHEIAITGRVARLDLPRLSQDLAQVCATHARLFEPRTRRPPFERYCFLTMAVDDGYGGLEHRHCSALLCRRDDLPHADMKTSTEAYRRFLGLASHEYFHAWNVKRIKPAAFAPYDLERENYTPLLWLFEGFTSYYDDLALRRAGLLTPGQYLDTLATTVTTVLQRSGRLKQSLAESSFDAWIKYYKQDENAPNSVVSYYQKGALVAAGLDLLIRGKTAGRRSLDDVMRLFWRRCKSAGATYGGVTEQEIAPAIREATGVDLARTLRAWTRDTSEPDFAELLPPFGIQVERSAAVDSPHYAMLGCRLAVGAEGRISQVFDGSPAQLAGLSAGDQLVALDGLRAGSGRIDSLLARYRPGDRVEVLAFRREELLRFELQLATRPPEKWKLTVNAKAPARARRLRAGWLGPHR